jgi:hypothetical protein
MTFGPALLLAAMAGAGGHHHPAAKANGPALDKPFEIRAGETAVIASEGLKIRFREVKNDSRCAQGLSCVWAGDAETLLEVETDPKDRAEVGLHTHSQFATSASFGKYRIQLQELRPLAKREQAVNPREYVVTLLVSLGNEK